LKFSSHHHLSTGLLHSVYGCWLSKDDERGDDKPPE
jgi:hypothetical protein